jgi:membrane protease YdiL (CAAX protease family)
MHFLLAAGIRNPPPTPTPSGWDAFLLTLVPIVGYAAIAPILYLFFGRTWRELDLEAMEHREEMMKVDRYDYRPGVLFAITAVILTLQQYFGGGDFFALYIRPWLTQLQNDAIRTHSTGWASMIDMRKYGELYSFGWWAFTRCFGYTVLPMALWKLCFPKDSILDMGLRTKGLLRHIPIYALCLFVVVPAVVIVARQPDFATYYPFYSQCQRSWMDLIIWETMYFAQFFCLEVFFRGFWLYGLRTTLGSGAIFAMIVPYCMIHYGKPYLETVGAVIAGVALGSLSMRTKSIYSGFLVHVTVAALMDWLSLLQSNRIPKDLFPLP